MTMKTKKKIKFHILRNNRGSSIVFALGVLTVILIVVMLFASRAKVSSSVSAIQLENQAVRALAKSLIPRIMLTINESPEVQDQILFSSIYDHSQNDRGADSLSRNYDTHNLYTYDWLWKLEHPAHINFVPTKLNQANNINSLGTFAFYREGKYGPEFTTSDPFLPTWQYILDIPSPGNENEDGNEKEINGDIPYNDAKDRRNVIARFAYIIVPKVAHLNPNAIADHTNCKRLSSASIKIADHANCDKCARKLGNSAAELMFPPISGSAETADMKNLGDGYYMDSPIANAFQKNEKIKWSEIKDFRTDIGDESALIDWDAADDDITKYVNNRNTVTRFMEIDEVGDREAFWSDDGYKENGELLGKGDGYRDHLEFYHRFNMRRTDWEYLTVDDIKQMPKPYDSDNSADLEEPGIAPGKDARKNFDTGGIAWLANWKDGGDWENKDRTQNQVIANLLNYCSPPTRPVVSDVAPKNWKKIENVNEEKPSYTGLKRTLYINEYYYDLQFRPEVAADYTGETDNKTEIDVTYTLNSEFMVELVDMYLNTLGDKNNNPVKFNETMNRPDFSTYHPEIYGTLKFDYYDPTLVKDDQGKIIPRGWVTQEYSIHEEDTSVTGTSTPKKEHLKGLEFTRFEDAKETEPYEPVAETDRKYGYYGYFAAKEIQIKINRFSISGKVTEDDIYKNAVTLKAEDDPDYEGQKIQTKPAIQNVVLKIDKILLYRTPTEDEDSYLKWRKNNQEKDPAEYSKPEHRTFPDEDDAPDKKEYVDCAHISDGNFAEKPARPSVFNKDNDLFAICGDREVIDPRQNLRLKDWDGYAESKNKPLSDTAYTYKVYTSQNAYDKKNKLHTMPIQTYAGNGEQQVKDDVTGTNKVLTKSNSEGPKKSKSDTLKHDPEATNDPAWKMERGIKVQPFDLDSHISTAFIRHAVLRRAGNNTTDTQQPLVEHPMESLWELGAIHRGSKWQTLNISKSPEYYTAEGFIKQGADAYNDGDGPILDQVKMTNDCISYGKVNLVRHVDPIVRNTVIGALFRDMPVHRGGYYPAQGLDDSGNENKNLFPNKDYKNEPLMYRIYDKEDTRDEKNMTVKRNEKEEKQYEYLYYVDALYKVLYPPTEKEQLKCINKKDARPFRRTDFLAASKGTKTKEDKLHPIRQFGEEFTTDAREEQIIGRTVNLMKVDSTVNGATAILLVQMIKDSGPATVFKDWNGDGKIDDQDADDNRKNHTTQLLSGYRRFSDRDSNDKAFFLPPEEQKEKIHTKDLTSTGGKGTYQNGADTITGEVKVAVTLEFDTAKQKWKMVKYEYAE